MVEIDLLPAAGAYTLADLDAWPESTLVELHRGAIVVNPQPIAGHQLLVHAVSDWLQARRGPAMVFHGIGIAFDTIPADGFIPDITVLASGVTLDPASLWQAPGDIELVVEVLSPSTRDRDLGHKRDTYVAAGLAYWIVDPDTRAISNVNDATGLAVDELAAALWSD